MTIPMPKDARKMINLRPFRSANLPQKGEIMAEIIKVTDKAIPDHIEVC